MAFRVGQKVECIDDSKWLMWTPPNRPRLGVIYTVRGFYPTGGGLWLEEIRNELREYIEGFWEGAFLFRRFRPLVSTKTDISIFTAMLGPREKVTT